MNTSKTQKDTPATHACKVIAVTALTSDTFQVELQAPGDTTLHYLAGQYLQLDIDINGDGNFQPAHYSIANGYDSSQPFRLELFIQNSSETADKVLSRLCVLKETNATVQVTLAMGQAYLQTDLNLPHVLIAAGSGMSQIKCLTEAIVQQAGNTEVHIYWSNKNADEFFLLDEFNAWVSQYKNLRFTRVLETATSDWPGRSGYLYEVITEDHKNLEDAQVYLCGSPKMVYGTIDKLKGIGLREENCYSDTFEYSPRAEK